MEVLKSNLLIEDLSRPTRSDLKEGVFISLINADKVPPHLGLISKGTYRSITARGVKEDKIDSLLNKLTRRGNVTLFIKINIDENKVDKLFSTEIKSIGKLEVNKTTCLTPIKKTIENMSSLDLSSIRYVFELIPILIKEELVEEVFVLNKNISEFELLTYNQEDIDSCILRNK